MKATGQDARVDAVIGLMYDAALDVQLWSDLAPKIASAFDSTSTVLKIHDAESRVQLVEVTENLIVAPKDQDWADHWHRNDLWVERSVAYGPSRIVTNTDLLTNAELERTAFYQDWLRHLDIYNVVGTAFSLGGGTVGVFGIHRPKNGQPYGHEDRLRVSRFLPHLNRALRVRQRLQEAAVERCATLEVLDRLDTGVVVVTAQCHVLHSNRLAERILRGEAGIRVHAHQLTFVDARLGAQFTRLVREAVRTAAGVPEAPGGALAISRPGRLPITVLVTPLRATGGCPPAAIVFMRDPEEAGPAQETLRELFGLTRTEAAIGAALAEGQALEQIAATFAIGLGTVRSHLKMILAKTDTHRQAQLVALIARSVATLSSTKRPEKR